MSSLRFREETIEFPHDEPIVLDYESSVSYINKSNYDRAKMVASFVWHMIIIHHRGKYPKKILLAAIFRAVGDEEFFPMVYKEETKWDRFLVRQCQPALDKLFEKNLYLTMPDGLSIKLEVVLRVAKYKFEQISPSRRIEKALSILFKNLEKGDILNLNEFRNNPEFSDIVVNLRNKAVLEAVCLSVFRNEDQFRRVNGLRLAKNHITSLQPLKIFNNCEFDVLDLRNNLLTSSSRICKELREIKIKELFLEDNPVTESEEYPENLKSLFGIFTKLDGKTIQELQTMPRASERDDETMQSRLIDPMKPRKLKKFQNSDEWHSITIINRKGYTKQELLDAFFDAFPPVLSEIYPCNYKDDEHMPTFYIRECYEQLKYLVDDCRLQISAPNPEDDKLILQLKMNVKSSESEPLDALRAIGKAIAQRFNTKDRLLDLEDFNSAAGLENIELNMRSSKVVNRVLTQAGNRFARQIFELRLGNNRIRSCNFAKPFIQMLHLRVLDLSHNNLKDFSDIMELEKLPIKSLNLNGNPLCELYTYAPEYIKIAKAMFPDLTKLDGVEMNTINPLVPKKNFLCDVNGYDLVQQFVGVYFPVFDSENRISLQEMYHPKAIFTMTCNYSMSKLNSRSSKRIARYTNMSRNILKMSDFSRATASLNCGIDEICEAFACFPNTEHDIVGFNTDTSIFTENMTVITISGLFKDVSHSTTDPDLILSFTRTFVLIPYLKNAGMLKCATLYRITNDFISVTNPSEKQMKNSFKFLRNPKQKPDLKLNAADREGRLVMFQELTTLKTLWCKRILDEGDWDFKRSIEVFLQEGKKNRIPLTAFR